MYIPKVTDENKFTIWGENISETETILKIYKSAVFKSSDTRNNPDLSISKFAFRAQGSGKILFYRNCASCHSIHKRLAGPPLDKIIDRRNSDWIYKFLTDRKAVTNDSSYVALGKEYGLHCLEFTYLSKEDVNLIVDFIKNE